MDIDERVKVIVAEVLGVQNGTIAAEAKIEDDLCADSLHKVEIMMALEKTFDIEISEETTRGLKTVQDIVDCVTRFYAVSRKVTP